MRDCYETESLTENEAPAWVETSSGTFVKTGEAGCEDLKHAIQMERRAAEWHKARQRALERFQKQKGDTIPISVRFVE